VAKLSPAQAARPYPPLHEKHQQITGLRARRERYFDRQGACGHLAWRAFLQPIVGFGLHRPATEGARGFVVTVTAMRERDIRPHAGGPRRSLQHVKVLPGRRACLRAISRVLVTRWVGIRSLCRRMLALGARSSLHWCGSPGLRAFGDTALERQLAGGPQQASGSAFCSPFRSLRK